MAEVKTGAKTETVFLPRASETEQQFEFVGVNGKFYQVPRGKSVEVPAEVAEVLRNKQFAEAQLAESISEAKKLDTKPKEQ